jgi:hypothetical protein
MVDCDDAMTDDVDELAGSSSSSTDEIEEGVEEGERRTYVGDSAKWTEGRLGREEAIVET